MDGPSRTQQISMQDPEKDRAESGRGSWDSREINLDQTSETAFQSSGVQQNLTQDSRKDKAEMEGASCGSGVIILGKTSETASQSSELQARIEAVLDFADERNYIETEKLTKTGHAILLEYAYRLFQQLDQGHEARRELQERFDILDMVYKFTTRESLHRSSDRRLIEGFYASFKEAYAIYGIAARLLILERSTGRLQHNHREDESDRIENWRRLIRVCEVLEETIGAFRGASEVQENISAFENIATLHEAEVLSNAVKIGAIWGVKDVDVNAVSGPMNSTALHEAVSNGNIDIVRQILACKNVDVNAVNGIKFTALHMAVSKGKIDILRELLACKAVNVNAVNGMKSTALHMAVYRGNIDIVRQLLACQDVHVNAVNGRNYTALHEAVSKGNIDIVRQLLACKNVDVNAVNWLNSTALHLAVSKENIDIVRQLLACKDVNVNAVNGRINTALHQAVFKGNIDIVRQLLACKDVDVNAVNEMEMTALHIAVSRRYIDIVRQLLACKESIRPTEEDYNGRTPIEIAHTWGCKDIERVLMEHKTVSLYVEALYKNRQVYVDAANAILVGAALIASVTFASWLQPPMGYTGGYVDVEDNGGLTAFWVFNTLSFYFAIATVVFGARSVLPKQHVFIKRIVEKLRINLLVTSVLLTFSVSFVIVAFGIAGSIVLRPKLKAQWVMIGPTIIGGLVCVFSLGFLFKSILDESVGHYLNHILHKVWPCLKHPSSWLYDPFLGSDDPFSGSDDPSEL